MSRVPPKSWLCAILTRGVSCCAHSWGICLFAYQSLDSIDGKQARRTGMAGPLGELFDHGCDAINTTVSSVSGAFPWIYVQLDKMTR